jgi:prepilin-type N-terminal cleavage/methylation domain-containing protein
MNASKFCRLRRRQAFSLPELIVTITILGLVGVGIATFTIQALNIYHYDSGRILVNKDIRSFTQELSGNAIFANKFRIYKNFATRTVIDDGVTIEGHVADGMSGDFLVLMFFETNVVTGKVSINRLIGYYRDPDSTDAKATGPVRKFDVDIVPAVSSNTSISSLLNTYVPVSTAHTHEEVIQLAQGLSNGSLFYNFYDRSVMIKGQIIEKGNQYRRAVNTYNFTVSPRG